MIDPYVGKYYSLEWVRRNVLYQTDDEIEEIDTQMQQEAETQAQQQAEQQAQMAAQGLGPDGKPLPIGPDGNPIGPDGQPIMPPLPSKFETLANELEFLQ